jgi:hypothetical protein
MSCDIGLKPTTAALRDQPARQATGPPIACGGGGRDRGADRRAGQGIRNSSPGDEAAVFAAAEFTGPEHVVVPGGRTIVRSVDDLVAETFSLSSTAPHLFGDRLSEFEADLRRLLAEVSPDGRTGQ